MQVSCASVFFLVTDFQGANFNRATEKQHGLNGISAAAECKSIEFLVFSSAGACEEVPEAVDAFKSKLAVEQALKQSGLKYAILRPHAFFENFNMPAFPLKQGVAVGMLPPDCRQHYIACRDIGKAAAAMIDAPSEWSGETLDCTVGCLSGHELGVALTQASGEACEYKQSIFFKGIKWCGYFGFLNGIRALIWHLETSPPPQADADRFKRVVPDALTAEEWFASVAMWSNGQPFKRNASSL